VSLPQWRRAANALLYPLFSLLPLIPLARRWRRGPALARLLGPAPDPDGLRKLAASLGAEHVVNGGRLAGSASPLLLFLSAGEMLLAAAHQPERILERYSLARLEEIRVDGEPYQPRYVSFAKVPPRRETEVDRAAVSRLALVFASRRLDLEYDGPFARHLAEAAAHTLHDLRKLPLDGVPTLKVIA